MAIDDFVHVATDYNAVFHRYVANETRRLINEVCNITKTVPTTTRLDAWHILDLGLMQPGIWPLARDLLLTLAPKMEQEGFRDEWMPLLDKGVRQSQAMKDISSEAELTLALGRLQELHHKYGCAKRHLQQSIVCFDLLQDQNGKAKALNRLAFVARQQDDYQRVQQLSQEALKLLDCDNVERANCFYLLGAVAFDQQDWNKAEQFYRISLAVWEESRDVRRIASGYRNLGNALGCRKKYEEAMDSYIHAIKLFEKIHDPVNLAVVRMNLGNIHIFLDQPSHALILFAQAEALFHKIQNEKYLAMIYMNQGIAYHKLCNWAYAEEILNKSIQLWQRLGHTRYLINSMDELGLVYLKQGFHQCALSLFNDALYKLNQVMELPNYERLKQLLTTHTEQAKNN